MSTRTVFIVHATHPTSEGWEEREAALYHIAGRRWDWTPASSGKTRELCWHCDSFEVARELRDALLKVGGVSVVARDPIRGK